MLFYALLGSFSLSALLAIAWVAALDRNEPLRRAHERNKRTTPTYVAPLPIARDVGKATAYRKGWRP